MSAWRGVETQHAVATVRLVDISPRQALLEELLEDSKPPMPVASPPRHYLLGTPFQYRPAHRSRFRPAHAGGSGMGRRPVHAACAEVAYWRHRFILDSAGLRDPVLLTEPCFFQAVLARASIDLMEPPGAQARNAWTHGSDYGANHAVAAEAQRSAMAELRVRARSRRALRGGVRRGLPP